MVPSDLPTTRVLPTRAKAGNNALPAGYRLGEYTIKTVLGHGGFGITYLAQDTHLGSLVAIKEYFPQDYAERGEDSKIFPRPGGDVSDAEIYNWGLQEFLKEAQALAKFKHNYIVRVLRYLEANGTAYMSMEYEEGESLTGYLKQHGGFLSEPDLLRVFLPILTGLHADFDRMLYKNPVVGSTYEPGSTFKPLVMATAIDNNLVKPDTEMDEDGPVQVGPYFIRTWNNKYNGKITMTQVLERSSNVGMVFVARKLGRDKLIQAIKDYGFGRSTDIDLEDETSPTLRPDDDWKEIDEYTASFGQGIAVTPIQMVRAVAALANGGKMMEPHIVSEIRDSKGKTVTIKPKVVREVVRPETASIVTEMMVSAVENGDAKWAKPKGYRIAGKTGTAQIPVAGHYDESKTIASFVGFAPADKPKFVILVTLREPTSSPWGSETAAPLFFSIARDLFTYWGVPPQ